MKHFLKVKGSGGSNWPPLLFIHGAWHGAWCWEPLMNFLAEKGVTSYALDLPGHGKRKVEGVIGLGIMDYVAAVESTVSELSLTSPILVGHSMGGLIVQKYLEKNDATAAVLIAPCPAMGGSLRLLFKYAMRQPIAGLTATFGRRTAIRDKALCRRLFFNHISPELPEDGLELTP